ncbi:MAG: hypothetical protein ACRDG3_02340 [Tepidiformaceae bacterium]
MSPRFARLDFAPGWQATSDNVVELAGLFDDEQLDWVPRAGEWPARVILFHLVSARYHGPIASPGDVAHMGSIWANCHTREGIEQELRVSWEMLARFLCDEDRLDAVYPGGDVASPSGPPPPPLLGSVERAMAGMDLGYGDQPEHYTGHYIAYHRFAHDLHHRSTLIDYLSQLGVSLDGHRIRPL